MNNDTKAVSPKPNDRIYDQFALGNDGLDCITSGRAMRVLRWLRKKPTTEGVLANACSERPYLYEWVQLIELLIKMGYIESKFSGHGTTKVMSLTENGEMFLENRLGPKEPEQVEPEQTTQQG